MSLRRKIDKFFDSDAAGGIFLMLAAALAMMIANSSLAPLYQDFLEADLSITLNDEGLTKPLILWINDGLMAVFFLLVGLELKRELLEGKLSRPSDVLLPGAAAVGGMIVPALIYAGINMGNPETIRGWAIPAATDIAFALGILALVGSRAPTSLKIFLLTLAILDDLGAILIIALFYTSEMKIDYLIMAVVPLGLMVLLNRRGAHRIAPTLILGTVLWVLILKSGVHATLAGVITAFCLPLKDRWGKSPLHSLENGLTPYVLYLIIPLFAFANAGVVLTGLSLADLLAPVPLGVAAGLFVGKQIGVMGVTWALVRMGKGRLPHGANWWQIYGIACLAGIGFTMSLFIGGLSFSDGAMMNDVRLGVLAGSLASAVMGYGVLMLAGSRNEAQAHGAPEKQPALEDIAEGKADHLG
ncbi:Na+/H+ antiporter NhaA [Brevirhabdus pacifica]|uniref:Na(+)/H(+) antiporter NhaA n=1 Tax=Brevirhabdus pacifica TaxID=1267768 RepID=A0A1U7DGC4_9RHOB|nr:Na+/H+ antiporter NhaA [Brevirhabdus pacifica]APX88949.1 Na+/H+ antiporter NhaA [Brevirhabdus pacifica]PJJ86498.1 sodium/proton antiporter (NhaA family) [Brevirhabdus pacifica]